MHSNVHYAEKHSSQNWQNLEPWLGDPEQEVLKNALELLSTEEIVQMIIRSYGGTVAVENSILWAPQTKYHSPPLYKDGRHKSQKQMS